MEYGGKHARQSDLYGAEDAVVKITKTFFKVSMLMKTETLFSCNKPLKFSFVFLLFLKVSLPFIDCIAQCLVKFCGRARYYFVLMYIWLYRTWMVNCTFVDHIIISKI
jgi:hypothetical protein